jgi:hypothetical protein
MSRKAEVSRIETKHDLKSFRYEKSGSSIFVFDPIFLESPADTYMVNWLVPEMAAKVKRDIWTDNNKDMECHTYLRLAQSVRYIVTPGATLAHILLHFVRRRPPSGTM